MIRYLLFCGVLAAIFGGLAAPATSEAAPSNGSLLVPGDVAPGNYWATPTRSIGGYVEVCADYQCDIGTGLIDNYSVDGRTMVVVPYNARMVNVDYASLTPVNVSATGASWSAPAPASGATVTLPPGAQPCPGPHTAVGTSVTSCAFANQVGLAYAAGGPRSSTPRQVEASSPVTGQTYSLACAANGSLVTCSGGEDAIIYLY